MESKIVEFSYNSHTTVCSSTLYRHIIFLKFSDGRIQTHGIPGLEEPIAKIQDHIDQDEEIINKHEWNQLGCLGEYEL
jgi:hypothetical protein